MRINHNLASLNTYRELSINQANSARSLEKLSSGLRINRAGDDAAGLATSEKMRAQIKGLDQAQRNAQNGISLIQTAEGALNETHSILQRMRELAVQSANDTNVTTDRSAMQQEVNQLISEIDRIGNTTEFNTKTLLNGGANVSASISTTGTNYSQISILGGSGDTTAGASFVVGSFTVASAYTTSSTISFAGVNTALSAASSMTVNGVNFQFTTSNTVQDVLNAVNAANLGVAATWDGTSHGIRLTSSTIGSKSTITASTSGGDLAGISANQTAGLDAWATFGGLTYTSAGNTITVQSGTGKGLQLQVSGTAGTTYSSAYTATVTVNTNGGLNMQIGANQGQSMYISISDMRSAALGVNVIDISTSTAANSAITTIGNSVTTVSTERAKVGAYQNRLEHTIANLGTSSENLTAAESRIRDVDMAKEMMEFTKNNILTQAAQAMLAQANQQPQGVLQLLR